MRCNSIIDNYSVFGVNYSGIRILFGNFKWTEYRIRIVLFGVNYSNNELFELFVPTLVFMILDFVTSSVYDTGFYVFQCLFVSMLLDLVSFCVYDNTVFSVF